MEFRWFQKPRPDCLPGPVTRKQPWLAATFRTACSVRSHTGSCLPSDILLTPDQRQSASPCPRPKPSSPG
ncbi:mCG59983 [Mus musculus]|nr:mCG59983 [Mus musculus]